MSTTALSRRALLQAAGAAALVGAGLGTAGCDGGDEHASSRPRRDGSWANWSGGQTARPRRGFSPRTSPISSTEVQRAKDGARRRRRALVQPDRRDRRVLVSLDGSPASSSTTPRRSRRRSGRDAAARARRPAVGARPGAGESGRHRPQSLGGAVGTSTHGTGVTLGSLSSAVRGVRLVTAGGRGDRVQSGARRRRLLGRVYRDGDARHRDAAPHAEPRAVRPPRNVYTAPLAHVLRDLDKLVAEHRHFEFWAFYSAHAALVKTLDEVAGRHGGDGAAGDPAADRPRASGPRASSPIACRHWRARCNASRSALAERQRVDRSIGSFRARGPPLQRDGVRAAAGARAGMLAGDPRRGRDARRDDALPDRVPHRRRRRLLAEPVLRPRQRLDLHPPIPRVDYRELFAIVEPIFRSYEGRPHWGKLHSLGAEDFAELYPHGTRFGPSAAGSIRRGKLLNAHLRHCLGQA